ncbi:MAG: efflux RND transporter periplasmic adaptor subunit [Granulosicoccus sp.]
MASHSAAERLPNEESEGAFENDQRSETRPQAAISNGADEGIQTDPAQPAIAVTLAENAADEVIQIWLNAQCDMIAGATCGIVVDGSSKAAEPTLRASWPLEKTTFSGAMINAALSAMVERTVVIVSGEGLANPEGETEPVSCLVATPLQRDNSSDLIAVFELPHSIRQQREAITQLLQWGGVWFGLLSSERPSYIPKDRLVTVVELLATSLEHDEFDAAITATVTELATCLSCSRVSLGLVKGSSVTVCALSNSSRVDARQNLLRDISSAMNEAVDQDATVTWPTQKGRLPHITHAQEVLVRHGDSKSILSTPLYDGPLAVGALTLEFSNADNVTQDCIEICETLARLLGPVFSLKQDKERSIVLKIWAKLQDVVATLCGREKVALKLYLLLLLGSLAFFSTASGDYRVTAQARLEGSVKRVVTAPLNGFVASTYHRAGDLVKAGDLLAKLDDRDLLLERVQLSSQQDQLDKEHRAALSSHDRSATAIINARSRQVAAQISLIDQQLLRIRLQAPFDGMVVSGDLSQSIGSPVENGQVLFEIAPLEDYRVVLEVDERDIGNILEEQSGVLTLTGLPDSKLPFTVDRIVPLSTPREGRNVFEVQGELDEQSNSIRPGMEGIAKVTVERRKLIWVWTHELIDWLKLTLWAWIS